MRERGVKTEGIETPIQGPVAPGGGGGQICTDMWLMNNPPEREAYFHPVEKLSLEPWLSGRRHTSEGGGGEGGDRARGNCIGAARTGKPPCYNGGYARESREKFAKKCPYNEVG